MTTMVYETEENSRPSTTSASMIQLQEEKQNLLEENSYLRQEVDHVEDKVHQLTHELTQKQMLVKLYHSELEGIDGKRAEKKSSNWKSNFNCLKSKAQILENEKWELTVELEARKADLANREQKLESLHASYIKQIESLKRNVSRNEDILRDQAERNAALQAEKTLLKEKLDIAAIEVTQARHDLEIRDRQMEDFASREMNILHEIHVRQQEIDNLQRLHEDHQHEARHFRGTSLSLNGRCRSKSANETTEHLSIKEELEESLRKEMSVSRTNSFGGVWETMKSANRQYSSFDESGFPDPFSPCRESQNRRSDHLDRSPTFSVGGDSGWGSDDDASPHVHRFAESHRPWRHKLPSRLQLVKPLKGSETLHQWKQLATPSLTKLFEPREGIVTREELRSKQCAHVMWNTREQMLSEPEEDDDTEVIQPQDVESRDPRFNNQSVAEEMTPERFDPPHRVCSQESMFYKTEPMRPRSRSLVEKVCQFGIRARRERPSGFGAALVASKTKSMSEKTLSNPTLFTSDSLLSSSTLRRNSTASSGGLEDVIRGFLHRRKKTGGSIQSIEPQSGKSHSGPSSPNTTLYKHTSNESLTSRLGDFIDRAFSNEHEQTILCVPASRADVTDSTWRLHLPNDSKSESPTKLKIKIGSKPQCESDHPLEQIRRGPVGVLHILTSMREGNRLTGGSDAISDTQTHKGSPYRGDIVLDLF